MSKKRLGIASTIGIAAFVGGWLWAGTGDGGSRGSGDDGAAGQVVMYQNPACGCCSKWAAYMESNGYDVEINKTGEINRIKERAGLAPDTASCHTAFIDGYFVEGHVPFRDVERMLRERPDIKGITVPGMPTGSPGMEGNRVDRYDVLAVHHDGTTSVYASY